MNRGFTAQRYRLGTDPVPYPRIAWQHERGNHIVRLRIRKHMHVIRWWRQEDGR